MLCGSLVPHPQPGRIDSRKIILQVNAAAHRNDRLQGPGQNGRLVIVLRRIIRDQERATIEKQSSGSITATDHADCIRRMAQFGSCLGQILRTDLHVLLGFARVKIERGGHKATTALMRVASTGFLQLASHAIEFLAMRVGNTIDIQERHLIVARVV